MKDKYISMKEIEEGIRKGDIKLINHILKIEKEDKTFKIDNFNEKYIRMLNKQIKNKKGD